MHTRIGYFGWDQIKDDQLHIYDTLINIADRWIDHPSNARVGEGMLTRHVDMCACVCVCVGQVFSANPVRLDATSLFFLGNQDELVHARNIFSQMHRNRLR